MAVSKLTKISILTIGVVIVSLFLSPFIREEYHYRRLSKKVDQFRPKFDAYLHNNGLPADKITLYVIKAGHGIVAIGGVGQHGDMHDSFVKFIESSALSDETIYYSTKGID